MAFIISVFPTISVIWVLLRKKMELPLIFVIVGFLGIISLSILYSAHEMYILFEKFSMEIGYDNGVLITGHSNIEKNIAKLLGEGSIPF